MDGVDLRETSKSLHGPVKQAPANNAWTIHWHADISIIKKNMCQENFVVHKLGQALQWPPGNQ